MPKTIKLQPETRYSTEPRLKKELESGHLRKDDANQSKPMNYELALKKYWHSPLPTLTKSDRDHNIAYHVKRVWAHIQLAVQRVQQGLLHRPAPVPRPQYSTKVKLNDRVKSYGYDYNPRNQIGISLPQLRYEIFVIHRKIKDLSLKLQAVSTKRQTLQEEMLQNQNRLYGHIANAFQAELNIALNREQMHNMYLVCQQFVRTQPTLINIQTNNEYMRLGASIVTAERLRLVFERTDLQPLMQQHQVKQDGLQRQVDTLIGQQQQILGEIKSLHDQLIGHQNLAEKMGATVEWVAAAEAARAQMQMDPEVISVPSCR